MDGATVKGNSAEFRVWAPAARRVTLRLMRRDGERQDIAMQAGGDGVYRLTTDAKPGDRYFYLVDNDPLQLPDPVSRLLPDDVHGATEIVDPLAHQWGDRGWKGIAYGDYVIYEIHVGTFTPGG